MEIAKNIIEIGLMILGAFFVVVSTFEYGEKRLESLVLAAVSFSLLAAAL